MIRVLCIITEFRVTEAKAATKLSQGASIRLIQRREVNRAIHHTCTVGKSPFYRPFGDVLVAFGVTPESLLPPTAIVD